MTYDRRQSLFLIALAALLVASMGAPAYAGQSKHKKSQAAKAKAAAPQTQAPQQDTSSLNAIAQTFASKGVNTCAPRIDQVTNFLSAGGNAGAFVFVPPKSPNQNMSSVSLEIAAPKQPAAYASASFVPTQGNGCAAVYDAVAWWPMKCDAVAHQQFAGKKVAPALKQNIAVLELDGTTRVFLMPAGEGCVSIKKEVII